MVDLYLLLLGYELAVQRVLSFGIPGIGEQCRCTLGMCSGESLVELQHKPLLMQPQRIWQPRLDSGDDVEIITLMMEEIHANAV